MDIASLAETPPSISLESIAPVQHQQRNDNSNPQQGSSGKQGAISVAVASAKAPLFKGMSSTFSRPTLKVPPNKRDSRKLFVGGLPSDITQDEFHSFFTQFGAVVDSVVMIDRDTHRSRGFGFVTFEDPDVSRQLLGMNQDVSTDTSSMVANDNRVGRLLMRGKMIEVKSAEPKESAGSVRRTYQPTRRPPNQVMSSHYLSAMGASANDSQIMYGTMQAYNGAAYSYYGQPMVAGYVAPMYYPVPSGALELGSSNSYAVESSSYPASYSTDSSSVAPSHTSSYYFSYASTPASSGGSYYGSHASVMQPVAPGIPGKEEEPNAGLDPVHSAISNGEKVA